MPVLVLNCGSSSVKLAVLDPASGERAAEAVVSDLGGAEPSRMIWRVGESEGVDPIAPATHATALDALVGWLRDQRTVWDSIEAAGHRVVHGGESFHHSVRIDDAVVRGIEAASSLAPLHNPTNLLGIRALERAFPGLPQVAVFDTAFHQTLPPRAYLYAVPRALHREHGVRRYGFHGTSHRYVAREAARLLERPLEDTDLVTLHLGNGCSATAVKGGRSIDTTMGLSPLEGLVMGTRSGDVDPGLHAHLADRLGLDVHGVTSILNRESGLLGVSELSNDMRSLEEASERGHEGARLAISLFEYRLAKHVAGLVVALGRLDGVVFTGGIGENSAALRARVLDLLSPFGFELDAERNREHGRSSRGIVTGGGEPAALVVPTDEERLIAAEAAAVVAG